MDRDGILNQVVMRGATVSSPRSIAEFKIIPNAKAIVESVRNKGYYVVVVTNQPDVSRGFFRSEDLEQCIVRSEKLSQWMKSDFASARMTMTRGESQTLE